MNIVISKSDITNYGSQIVDYSSEFKDEIKKFSALIESINTAWDGADALKYINTMKEKYIVGLEEIKSVLDEENEAKLKKFWDEIEIGKKYKGIVSSISSYGAFIDLGGGKEGLLHISKISKERVEKIEDVLSVGDRVIVKVLDIDKQGKISLKKIGEQSE